MVSETIATIAGLINKEMSFPFRHDDARAYAFAKETLRFTNFTQSFSDACIVGRHGQVPCSFPSLEFVEDVFICLARSNGAFGQIIIGIFDYDEVSARMESTIRMCTQGLEINATT